MTKRSYLIASQPDTLKLKRDCTLTYSSLISIDVYI